MSMCVEDEFGGGPSMVIGPDDALPDLDVMLGHVNADSEVVARQPGGDSVGAGGSGLVGDRSGRRQLLRRLGEGGHREQDEQEEQPAPRRKAGAVCIVVSHRTPPSARARPEPEGGTYGHPNGLSMPD